MRNPWEFVTKLEDDAAQIGAAMCRMSLGFAALSSYLRDRPTSSPTPIAASSGDGSVRATTGLTDAQWDALLSTIDQWCAGERSLTDDTAGLWARLSAWRSWLDSEDCANGSAVSPRPRSDAPPDNSHGESCEVTSPPSHWSPTPTLTRTEWSERLRTVAARLRSLSERCRSLKQYGTRTEVLDALTLVDELLDLCTE